MNHQQANRRIAEILGWTEMKEGYVLSPGLWGCIPGDSQRLPVPDYCGDLNACHKMEKSLESHEWPDYAGMLWLYDDTLEVGDWMLKTRTHASAEQRSAAFLRVKDPTFFTP